jgi:hypothetical protein
MTRAWRFGCGSGALLLCIGVLLLCWWLVISEGQWDQRMDAALFIVGYVAYCWKYASLAWFRVLNLDKKVNIVNDFVLWAQGWGEFTEALSSVVVDCVFQFVVTACEVLSHSALPLVIFRASALIFWLTGKALLYALSDETCDQEYEKEHDKGCGNGNVLATAKAAFTGSVGASILASLLYGVSLAALHWGEDSNDFAETFRFAGGDGGIQIQWNHSPFVGIGWNCTFTLVVLISKAQSGGAKGDKRGVRRTLFWRVMVGLLAIVMCRAFINGELLACCTVLKATLTVIHGAYFYVLSKNFEVVIFAHSQVSLEEIAVADVGMSAILYSLVHAVAFDDMSDALHRDGTQWHVLFSMSIVLHMCAVAMVFRSDKWN